MPTADQRIVLGSVSWERYEVEQAFRGDKRLPRMHYLAGALELTSPALDHERLASLIGRLVEVCAEERDIDLCPYRSWTLKSGPKEAGAEPDECYMFGREQSKDRPDLVIEVVWTRGGVDKLEIYRRLGIHEVWFWIENAIHIHQLVGSDYQRATESAWLPGLDVDLLCSFLDRKTINEAKRDYRAALRST